MAHALSITDGTTTISLSTTDWLMLHYVPNVPSYRNGEYEPVTDSIELTTDTASGSAAQTAINAVQLLLESARRRYETRSGPRVYLTLQLDSDASSWRSEVQYGQMVGGNDSLRAWQGIQPQTMVVTRVPFWEGAEATLVSSQSLTNSDGSNSYYSSATVSGVLPTPPIVTLSNNSGDSQTQRDIYFGVNAFNSPATFDGTLGTQALSDTAPYTYNTEQADWTLTAALTALHGDSTRFVGAFAGGYTENIWWKLSQEYGGVTPISNTSPVYPTSDSGLLDFGTMRVPTGGYSTTTTGIDLEIKTQSDATNLSCTLTFLQMFPANNTRRYSFAAANVSNGYAIVDDGVDGDVYMKSGSYRHDVVTAIGAPMMLHPGQGHRFLWLMRKSTGYVAADTCALTVAYRPRRLTV